MAPLREGGPGTGPARTLSSWEGRQGAASFYPFPVETGWLAFYAGAYPFRKAEDYPFNGAFTRLHPIDETKRFHPIGMVRLKLNKDVFNNMIRQGHR